MNFIFLALALVLTAVLIPIIIPLLKRMKFGQTIREEGPESHLVKTGTPTMGGLSFISVTVVLSIIGLFLVDDVYKLLVLIIVTLGFGLIGFVDDYISVVKKDNNGLSSKQKFLFQIIVAIIIYFIMITWISEVFAGMRIPVAELFIPLGVFFVVLLVFGLVGFSNAVYLTDGLDVLSTGTSVIAFGLFLAIAIVPGESEIALFLCILIG